MTKWKPRSKLSGQRWADGTVEDLGTIGLMNAEKMTGVREVVEERSYCADGPRRSSEMLSSHKKKGVRKLGKLFLTQNTKMQVFVVQRRRRKNTTNHIKLGLMGGKKDTSPLTLPSKQFSVYLFSRLMDSGVK